MATFNKSRKSLFTATSSVLDATTDLITGASNYAQAMSQHSERVLLDQKNKTEIHARTSKRDVLRDAMATQAESDKEWAKFVDKEDLSPEYLEKLQKYLEGDLESMPLY